MACSSQDGSQPIPSVDLAPFLGEEGVIVGEPPTPEQLAVANIIDVTCREHGFLHVKNFGLDKEMRRQAFDMATALFQMEDKSALARISPETNRGYAPFRSESINRSRPAELKEAFNLRFPPAHENDFTGCPAGFAEFMQEFLETMKQASKRYLIACALALRLDDLDFFV